MKRRCREADRRTHGKLQDEMEAWTELHRKSPVRLMHDSLGRKPRRLRQKIDDDPQHVFGPPCPEAGSPQNVHLTLYNGGKKGKEALPGFTHGAAEGSRRLRQHCQVKE